MAEDNQICVICGDLKPKKEMSVLAELRGICGHDLGYICKDCIHHIDNLKYFKRIEEGNENE